MTADELDAILAQAGITSSQIHSDGLEAICRSVSTLPAAEFIEACTQAPGLSWDDGQTRAAHYFEIHSRHWWIDVSNAENRRHLIDATTAAVLVDALRLNFSVSWVSRVWPTVIAVRSISQHADGLHLDLVRRGAARIPPDLAASINADDFADFIKAIEDAPAVLQLRAGGMVTFV